MLQSSNIRDISQAPRMPEDSLIFSLLFKKVRLILKCADKDCAQSLTSLLMLHSRSLIMMEMVQFQLRKLDSSLKKIIASTPLMLIAMTWLTTSIQMEIKPYNTTSSPRFSFLVKTMFWEMLLLTDLTKQSRSLIFFQEILQRVSPLSLRKKLNSKENLSNSRESYYAQAAPQREALD